jgi:hypothetical protein
MGAEGQSGSRTGAAGQSQGGQSSGGGSQRERIEQRLREAGVAAPPEQEREQLRDLNAITREIAPSAPVPAPEVEPRPAPR